MKKEVKEHQKLMLNNLKANFNTNLVHSFQALNFIKENSQDLYYQPTENILMNTSQEELMMTSESDCDPILEQLMK